MLNAPQDHLDLKHESNKNRRDPPREVAVMSFCFPEDETNTLYVGAEDGSVCQVHIFGTKVGITEWYEGHEGPVTSIHVHPQLNIDSSQLSENTLDLALTSSFDWS